MTDDRPDAGDPETGGEPVETPRTRRARIRSDVTTAEVVAAAIAPDDTDDIDTRVEDGAVVATIERPTTASLEATVDDYVVALGVATEVVEAARGAPTAPDADPRTHDADQRARDTDRRAQDANRHADTH